jgi:putative spermidine/putrescine transport system permease protein
MLGLVLFSYAVGTMPRAFSWLVMLGDAGLVNQALSAHAGLRSPIPMLYNQFGILVGMTHVMLPFMILILLGSMARVGPHLVPAARTLGATSVAAFWKVFFPLTRPGILAGTIVILVYSLGFYVVPAVLGGAAQTTVVMAIRDLALNLGIWGLAAALSTVTVAVSILGAVVYVRATKIAEVHDR